MDGNRFDRAIRTFAFRASRRGMLAGLAGGLLVASPLALGGMAAKAKKHKRKTRKPALNAFGCLNMGQACGGSDDLCCSGICEGTKPKKGKKDTSRCVAHDTGDCTVALEYCTVDLSSSKCGQAGAGANCMKTTGNAGFCGHMENFDSTINCRSCSKDTDCEAMTGPGSACVILDGGLCTVWCKAYGSPKGTACVPAAA